MILIMDINKKYRYKITLRFDPVISNIFGGIKEVIIIKFISGNGETLKVRFKIIFLNSKKQ